MDESGVGVRQSDTNRAGMAMQQLRYHLPASHPHAGCAMGQPGGLARAIG